ncbi:UNVERIFIED_CONTAM: hypothetical protein FKN15_009513 [Acipenser sinensis]
MASKTPVGFIGLGNMGSHMAKNLLKHGYPVFASDIFPESCKEIQDLGAQVLDSPAEVADRADRIITMLPSSPNVIEVYTGLKGILKKVKKGSLLIDSSTIDPSVSKKMAKEAEKMGAVFMDAPVSGVTSGSVLCFAMWFFSHIGQCVMLCDVVFQSHRPVCYALRCGFSVASASVLCFAMWFFSRIGQCAMLCDVVFQSHRPVCYALRCWFFSRIGQRAMLCDVVFQSHRPACYALRCGFFSRIGQRAMLCDVVFLVASASVLCFAMWFF